MKTLGDIGLAFLFSLMLLPASLLALEASHEACQSVIADEVALDAAKVAPDTAPVNYYQCVARVHRIIDELFPLPPPAPAGSKPSVVLRVEKKRQSLEHARASRIAFHGPLACAGLAEDPDDGKQRAPKNWRAYLPACPAVYTAKALHLWIQDSHSGYHPGAKACFRRSAGREWNWAKQAGDKWWNDRPASFRWLLQRYPPGQQCCYGDDGLLVTCGPGAGTPDLVFSDRTTFASIQEADDAAETKPDDVAAQDAASLGHAKVGWFDWARRASPASAHYWIDVRIIRTSLKQWPQGWQQYSDLGWGAWNPPDAKPNWGSYAPTEAEKSRCEIPKPIPVK